MGKRPQTAEIGKHLVTCPTIKVGRQRLVNSNIFFYFVCAQLNITCADIAQCKVELICFNHRYKIEFLQYFPMRRFWVEISNALTIYTFMYNIRE